MAAAVVGAGRSLLLLRYLGWRGRVAFRVLCRATRDGAKQNREEAKADEDAEVEGILLELAGTARRAAESAPGDPPREAGEMRKRALRVLEILQVRFCDLLGSKEDGNFEVEDLTGRTASESLAMVAQELERRAGLENRKIWALAARRALYVARRVERLHCTRESDSYAVVSVAARSAFLIPEGKVPVPVAEPGLGLEVRGLFDELANAAQQAAEWPAAAWQPAGLRQLAEAIRGPAARVLEILRVEPSGDVDVADLNGLGPGQLLEALSPELQRHTTAPAGGSRPAAEARRAWALTAGRVLDVARRLEEAGQLEPQAEASEASVDEQSEVATQPTLESGTTLDVAATSGWLVPSSSGRPEILGRVDEEELGGEGEVRVEASQRIVLQRQLLRAKIRTCPAGHDLHERQYQLAICVLCEEERGVTLCCFQCDWDICQECVGLAGLPHSHDADEDAPRRAVWSMLTSQSSMRQRMGDLPGAAALLVAALKQLRPGDQDVDDHDAANSLHYAGADHVSVASTLHELGMVRKQKGDLKQAEEHLKEALRMMKCVYGGAWSKPRST
ncbi:unnamed protein product [Effrenium voratum]|uniref:Uncharacterized protein n=1 Tax=Effrenium voratum TaxID=2562239 RepID=A0AA36INR5_9DINO|nr:unnamed protein product [Effrenium voratum]